MLFLFFHFWIVLIYHYLTCLFFYFFIHLYFYWTIELFINFSVFQFYYFTNFLFSIFLLLTYYTHLSINIFFIIIIIIFLNNYSLLISLISYISLLWCLTGLYTLCSWRMWTRLANTSGATSQLSSRPPWKTKRTKRSTTSQQVYWAKTYSISPTNQ